MNTIPDGPVAEFIDATNRHDADALLAVFAPTATVRDDGSDYTGSAEIRRWIQEHQIAPKITLDPTSYDEADDGTAELTASADGDFPGGPLPFTFDFTLESGRVIALGIRLAH
ncbi:nuclear transport factor 2 family protein [Microbacterium sp. ZW T6_19]|uniref:nuclear transport factor 2 family protein n=1 Tax=Microbacterium sp. ZW T6_19 TaxID=3378082 RepID=UPI0038535602